MKKWVLKRGIGSFFLYAAFAFLLSNFSDIGSYLHVEKNVPFEWKENILAKQSIEEVSMSKEREGHLFLGCGSFRERETFRYTANNEDGSYHRDKVYTSECVVLKAEDENSQRIEKVQVVREYKNKSDKSWFGTKMDKKDSFYRIYL